MSAALDRSEFAIDCHASAVLHEIELIAMVEAAIRLRAIDKTKIRMINNTSKQGQIRHTERGSERCEHGSDITRFNIFWFCLDRCAIIIQTLAAAIDAIQQITAVTKSLLQLLDIVGRILEQAMARQKQKIGVQRMEKECSRA